MFALFGKLTGINEGILAVGVLAGRQEAVHVADEGDGAALLGVSDNWLHLIGFLPILRAVSSRTSSPTAGDGPPSEDNRGRGGVEHSSGTHFSGIPAGSRGEGLSKGHWPAAAAATCRGSTATRPAAGSWRRHRPSHSSSPWRPTPRRANDRGGPGGRRGRTGGRRGRVPVPAPAWTPPAGCCPGPWPPGSCCRSGPRRGRRPGGSGSY